MNINLSKIFISTDTSDSDSIPDNIIVNVNRKGFRLLLWKDRLYAVALKEGKTITIELNLMHINGNLV